MVLDSGWGARQVRMAAKRSGRNKRPSIKNGRREPWRLIVFSPFPMSFFQEPHSRGHLSRPEAQSLSPYTTSANRAKLLAKNRQTFLLQTTKLTRLARRMCRDLLQPRRAARRPYAPINANAIKAECKGRSVGAGGRFGVALARDQCFSGCLRTVVGIVGHKDLLRG